MVITKKIKKGILADSLLREIEWIGEDSFCLRFETSDNNKIGFVFDFVTELDIGLCFKQLTGAPLVFEAEVRNDGLGWFVVVIEFGGAPEGRISFGCNRISLEERK